MQNRTQRRKRMYTAPPEENSAKLNASATAVLKALMLIQGLGILLNEDASLVVESYEDEEQRQHVIFATREVVYEEAWGNLLFEFVFAGQEIIIRWFSKHAGAYLPDTVENIAVDQKRCLTLYKCFLHGNTEYRLPTHVVCSVRENKQRDDASCYAVSLWANNYCLFFDLDSNQEITKVYADGCGRYKHKRSGRLWKRRGIDV